MNRKPVINSFQLAMLGAGSGLMFPYTFLPIVKGDYSNQDVWLIFIVSIFITVLLTLPLLFLTNKMIGVPFYKRNEMLLGKAGGKVVSIIYALFFLFCFTACMLIATIYVKIYILEETPLFAIIIVILIPVTYASIKGAGTIGRLASFVIPYIMLTIVFFFLAGIEKMKFESLLPILEDSTIAGFSKGVFVTAARFSEMLIIAIFACYLKKKSSVNKAYALGFTLFVVFFLLILVPVQVVLGSDIARLTHNPYYVYTRQTGGYEFIQRLQSLNILAWFSGTIIKLSIYSYMGTNLLSGTFKKIERKWMVVPFSVIGLIICELPFMKKTSTITMLASDDYFPYVIVSVILVIPLIMLILYLIRKKKINAMLEQIKASSEESNPAF
jgi:spore germination protein KB